MLNKYMERAVLVVVLPNARFVNDHLNIRPVFRTECIGLRPACKSYDQHQMNISMQQWKLVNVNFNESQAFNTIAM